MFKSGAFEFQGIVPSGVLLPLMQWGGRTHFLLAIVRQIPEVCAVNFTVCFAHMTKNVELLKETENVSIYFYCVGPGTAINLHNVCCLEPI